MIRRGRGAPVLDGGAKLSKPEHHDYDRRPQFREHEGDLIPAMKNGIMGLTTEDVNIGLGREVTSGERPGADRVSGGTGERKHTDWRGPLLAEHLHHCSEVIEGLWRWKVVVLVSFDVEE